MNNVQCSKFKVQRDDLVVRAKDEGSDVLLSLLLFLLVIAISEKGDAEVASRPGRPPRARHRSMLVL